MKKNKLVSLALLLVIASLSVTQAQVYTTLNQNFDGVCALTPGDPAGWMHYNPVAGTDPAGAWHCTPNKGRPSGTGSPSAGMTCTGVWGSAYHLDTSFLLTPRLDLSGYSNVYLLFDIKTDSIVLGGKLEVTYTNDTLLSSVVFVDSLFMVPSVSFADSSGWVTHQVHLNSTMSSSALSNPLYLAFRYTSKSISGSAWYLDNVRILPYGLGAGSFDPRVLPLTVLGHSASSRITLSLGNPAPGSYLVSVYDMMGREVRREQANITTRNAEYTIDGMHLAPGMYVIKVNDGNAYGIVKAIVQ